MLGLAISIAASSFEKVNDKGGQPYILHCLRVWEKVKHCSIDVQCAAILHDIVDDTPYTVEEIRALFNPRVAHLVDVLTHKSTQSYETYIDLVSMNRDTILIKMADLEDNSNITRLKGVRQKDFDRIAKYHKSYDLLRNCL